MPASLMMRDGLSRRQLGQHARPLALGVVLVIGAGRPRDREMGEQRAAVARVLAVDHIGPGQHGQRPQGDVGEVADRRGHHIEAGRQRPRDQLAQNLPGAACHACRQASRPSLLRHACTSPPIRVFRNSYGPRPGRGASQNSVRARAFALALPLFAGYLHLGCWRGHSSVWDRWRAGRIGLSLLRRDRRPGERDPVRIAACGLLDRRHA